VFDLSNKIQAVQRYNHFSLSVTPCYKYYIVYKFLSSTSQTIVFTQRQRNYWYHVKTSEQHFFAKKIYRLWKLLLWSHWNTSKTDCFEISCQAKQQNYVLTIIKLWFLYAIPRKAEVIFSLQHRHQVSKHWQFIFRWIITKNCHNFLSKNCINITNGTTKHCSGKASPQLLVLAKYIFV